VPLPQYHLFPPRQPVHLTASCTSPALETAAETVHTHQCVGVILPQCHLSPPTPSVRLLRLLVLLALENPAETMYTHQCVGCPYPKPFSLSANTHLCISQPLVLAVFSSTERCTSTISSNLGWSYPKAFSLILEGTSTAISLIDPCPHRLSPDMQPSVMGRSDRNSGSCLAIPGGVDMVFH